MVGIQPRIERETVFTHPKVNRLRWWNIFVLIYLHAISLKALAAIVLTKGGLDFWMQLTTFLRSSAATLTAGIYVYKQRKLQILLRRMAHVYQRFTESERRGLRRRIKTGATIVWIILVVHIATSMITACKMGVKKFLEGFFFYHPVSSRPMFALGCILLVVNQLVMWGTLSFMILLYIALCDVIKLSFRYFIRNLIRTFKGYQTVEENALLKIRQCHDHMSELVTRMDDIFSAAVFFWYSSFILSVCIDITFDLTLYKTMTNYPLLISVLKLAVLFGAYAVIGLSASLAIEESQKCAPAFFRLTTSTDCRPNHQGPLLMLGQQLQSTHLALTGWKFFTLSRSYMMTVIGVFVSYVIIIVQLNPAFMKDIINGGL